MIVLSRTVRFSVNPGDPPPAPGAAPPRPRNGFAGWPSPHGLARYYELRVDVAGAVSPVTGYFVNIQDIDLAVRSSVIPIIARACADSPATDPASLLPSLADALRRALVGDLRALCWSITPTCSLTLEGDDMTHVLLRQRFEFAASHRLHAPTLSDEENRRLFGKCNLPSGHGHNYVVEPAVRLPITKGAPAFTIHDLERLTAEHVIARYDHRHLNLDTKEFGESGVNPSVENIARVCFDLLDAPVKDAGASLHTVTVWETEKTSATYPA